MKKNNNEFKIFTFPDAIENRNAKLIIPLEML
jgi:hypothetical protein